MRLGTIVCSMSMCPRTVGTSGASSSSSTHSTFPRCRGRRPLLLSPSAKSSRRQPCAPLSPPPPRATLVSRWCHCVSRVPLAVCSTSPYCHSAEWQLPAASMTMRAPANIFRPLTIFGTGLFWNHSWGEVSPRHASSPAPHAHSLPSSVTAAVCSSACNYHG